MGIAAAPSGPQPGWLSCHLGSRCRPCLPLPLWVRRWWLAGQTRHFLLRVLELAGPALGSSQCHTAAHLSPPRWKAWHSPALQDADEGRAEELPAGLGPGCSRAGMTRLTEGLPGV